MDIDKEIDRADQLVKLGRYREAKQIVVKLLGQHQHSYFYQLLGGCELGLGNFDAAQRAVDQCLVLDAENDFGHFLSSLLEAQKERWSQSEQAVLRALELEPEHVPYITQLARVQLARNAKGAADAVERGLRIEPNNVELLNLRSKYQFASFDNDGGYSTTLEALREDPTNSSLLTTVGYRQLDFHQYKEATETFSNALLHDPENDIARQGLIEVYKVKWKLFRIFYKYGFTRWKLQVSFWRVVMWILLIKTMFIWGLFYVAFLLFTWWGDVCFNSVLRVGQKTKFLLSHKKIVQSNFFLVANLTVLVACIFAASFDSDLLWKISVSCGLVLFLGIAFLEVGLKRQRRSVGIAAGVMLAIVAFAFSIKLSMFLLVAMFLLIVFGLLFTFRGIGW